MARIPNKPEEIFPEIIQDYKTIYGPDLISIILFGSGARGDYMPGKSDLNFLVILSEGAINRLDEAVGTVARWRKRRVATPLFMTKPYILSSLDAYPVEFLNMQHHYVLVYGEDVLVGLPLEHGHLRLQFERELKGKLIHLRKGFLEAEGKPGPIRELFRVSLAAFLPLFSALLYLKDLPVPLDRRAVIGAAAPAYGFDAAPFLKGLDIREGTDRLSPADLQPLFLQYMNEVRALCDALDRLD